MQKKVGIALTNISKDKSPSAQKLYSLKSSLLKNKRMSRKNSINVDQIKTSLIIPTDKK
jgi:hypothetical protein